MRFDLLGAAAAHSILRQRRDRKKGRVCRGGKWEIKSFCTHEEQQKN